MEYFASSKHVPLDIYQNMFFRYKDALYPTRGSEKCDDRDAKDALARLLYTIVVSCRKTHENRS